jgi:hypothetical protein
MKQLITASINHEGTYKVLPNGGFDRSNDGTITSSPTYIGSNLAPATGDRQQGSWAFQILPFMEMSNLWEGAGGGSVGAKQANAGSLAIPGYFCPSRRRPTVSGGMGLIDYAGAVCPPSGASTVQAIDVITNDPMWSNCAIVRNRNVLAAIAANQASTYAISTAGIRDGSSNVLMYGEKQMNIALEPNGTGGPQDDNVAYCAGYNIGNMRSCMMPPQKDYVDMTEGNTPSNRNYIFGSSHTGVMVVGMCDGSTRTVTFQIDMNTFAGLCMRRDGAVLNLEQ